MSCDVSEVTESLENEVPGSIPGYTLEIFLEI